MYEVELRARVDDLDKMERKIRKLGAEIVSEYEHFDTYLGMKWEVKSVKSLKRRGGRVDILLRIREETEAGNVRKIFTMRKLPSDDSETREKVSIEIGDSEKMNEILEIMRAHEVLALHKRRKCFRLDNKEIFLDDIKELGKWIEVSIKGIPKGHLRKTKEKLERFMKRELGIDEVDSREYFRIAVEEML